MQIDIDELPCPALITDEQGVIVGMNTTMLELSGRSQAGLLSQNLDVLLPPGTRVFFQTHVLPTLRKKGSIQEIFVYLDGLAQARIPVYVNAKRTPRPTETRFVWLFFMAQERSHFEAELIEARKQAQDTAEQVREAHERLRTLHLQLQEQVNDTEAKYQSVADLAYKDSLTQLGNRRSLQSAAFKLASSAPQTQGFSVLMLDIDHFKRINDVYGHDRGDDVLRAVAHCIQQTARQNDTAIRYGGEEFAVVLPGADPVQALGVADRIHQEIQALQLGEMRVTVSIGVATADDPYDDLFKVLKDADSALYAAKHDGRNRSRHFKDPAPPALST